MPLRILHIEAGKQLYGGARQVVYLINELAKMGGEQALVCDQRSAIQAATLANCTTLPLRLGGELDVSMVSKISRAIQQWQPDVVHVHSRRGADFWGLIAAKQLNIPCVLTRRIDNPEWSLFAKAKFRKYDAVVSISRGVQHVMQRYCFINQRMALIPSAVDCSEYTFPADRHWLRTSYGVPLEHQVIANFAQLIERKGQATLIRAMVSVLEKHPQTTCLLFGKGKLAQQYQDLIDRTGLSEHIRLCGFSDQVARILPNIDVVAHPASAEGLGVILLQSAASARAIVSCPVGGIPDIIRHGKNGLLTKPGCATELAESINLLLSDTTLRQRLGAAARQTVEAHFTPQSMAQQYHALYHDLTR